MRRVIIIGASSGVGKKMALYYASVGCKVGIAARREDLLREIASQYPSQMVYRAADMTRSDEVGAVAGMRGLIQELGGVDLVIYSAGAGVQNPELDIIQEVNAVRVNAEGLVCVAATFFQHVITRKVQSDFIPQFVVISSLASVKGIGITASYSASKRFQRTYLDGLAQLATQRRVKIVFTTILPGFIRTNFISGRNFPMTLPLDYAVKRIINAVERKQTQKIIDWRWALVAFLWRLIPRSLWRRIKL